MSGPKVDQAELERQKQAELERQRLERIRIVRLAMNKYSDSIQYAKKNEKSIVFDRESYLRRLENVEEIKHVVRNIIDYKDSVVRTIESLVDRSIPSEPTEIEKAAQRIRVKIEDVIAEYESNLKDKWIRINGYTDGIQKEKEYIVFSKINSSGEHVLPEFVDYSFVLGIIDHNDNIDIETKQRIKEIIKDISDLLTDESVVEDDYKILFRYFETLSRSDGSHSEEMERMAYEYYIDRTGIDSRRNEFEALYKEYLTEYVECINIINKLRTRPVDIHPKRRREFRTIDELRKEKDTVQRISRINNERNYIRSQLNDIMSMYGYNICEDIVFNSSQLSQHYLCRGNTGKTAIHISVSDTKQIMMEVVSTEISDYQSVDEINATIVGENKMTDDEIEQQIKNQGQFCSIHPRIVEECKKRGIILDARTRQMPGREFAKKIICYGQYDVEEDLEAIRNNKRFRNKKSNGMVMGEE